MEKTVLEKAIDISRYNGVIDFAKVKESGIAGVIIRVGYRGYSAGNIKADDKFADNIKNAFKAGLKLGMYFMSQAINESEAIAEAEYCIQMAQGYDLYYPIAYDSEYSNEKHNGRADYLTKEQRTSVCKAFCEHICKAGYKASVYASKSWYSSNLDVSQLSGYYIWVAQYNNLCSYVLTDYNIWQYSSKGSVSGVIGNVDMNEVYTDFSTSSKASGVQISSVIEAKNGICEYSKLSDGNKIITLRGVKTNFKVKEFSCNDGSDSILIDVNLVSALQTIREHFGKPVSLNSAYRTSTYNVRVGGAKNSYHTKGQAADLKIVGVAPLEICKYAESIGLLGIGRYGTFTHIDTRNSKYFWNSSSGKELPVSTFKQTQYATLRKGCNSQLVAYAQQKLTEKGYVLLPDGKFGKLTYDAVKKYQVDNGLKDDGVIGINTWNKLLA